MVLICTITYCITIGMRLLPRNKPSIYSVLLYIHHSGIYKGSDSDKTTYCSESFFLRAYTISECSPSICQPLTTSEKGPPYGHQWLGISWVDSTVLLRISTLCAITGSTATLLVHLVGVFHAGICVNCALTLHQCQFQTRGMLDIFNPAEHLGV